jgi:hypothetical protein
MREKSSVLRILLHGFFLISTNLFSAMAAFALLETLAIDADKILQSFIALIINIGVYLAVYKLIGRVQKDVMKIDNFSMFAIILMVSLALLPSIFYPMHYLTRGEWSSFDNLLMIWPFQIIVNGICLVLNFFIFHKQRS